MNESFFGKNGTLQNLMNVTDSIKQAQSSSSTDRVGALGKLVSVVMSLLAA